MIRPQNVKDSLPQTLAQKIIARAAGKAEVEVDEIEIGSVDLAMIPEVRAGWLQSLSGSGWRSWIQKNW